MTKKFTKSSIFLFTFPICIFVLYIGYLYTLFIYLFYFVFLCRKPQLHYKKTVRNAILIQKMNILQKRFYPFIFAIPGFLQTYSDRFRRKKIKSRQQIKIKTKDGGIFLIDIFEKTMEGKKGVDIIKDKNNPKQKYIDAKQNDVIESIAQKHTATSHSCNTEKTSQSGNTATSHNSNTEKTSHNSNTETSQNDVIESIAQKHTETSQSGNTETSQNDNTETKHNNDHITKHDNKQKEFDCKYKDESNKSFSKNRNVWNNINESKETKHKVKNINQKEYNAAKQKNEKVAVQNKFSSVKGNVILVHGFNSSSDSSYIRNLAFHFVECNYRVFAFNSRGTKTELLTPIFFHIGWTSDLKECVDYVLKNFEGDLSLVGFSLGASWVAKFLGENSMIGRYERIKCGMGISLPFCFYELSHYMLKWPYKISVNRLMVKKMKSYINRFASVFVNAGVDIECVKKCTSMREIDVQVTQKIFNIADLDEHYKKSSAKPYIPLIKVPFMIINANDDPVVPFKTIPIEKCKMNENIFLVLTKNGGHIGFMSYDIDKNYVEDVVIDFVGQFIE